MRVTLRDTQRMKDGGERAAMVTAYDHPSAVLAERAGVPMLLVGDPPSMVAHGRGSTLPVTLDDTARHAAAVVRGTGRALVAADLPFFTCATEIEAVAGARRLTGEAGAGTVMLEGGAAVAPIVARPTALGVSVMGHLGFTPQAHHQIGLRVRGVDAAGARRLLADASALERAGAFSTAAQSAPMDETALVHALDGEA